MYFSMARITDRVHSAVEMLWAPRALQMVTCGPIAPGIHSVPAISESTSRTPLSRGTIRMARVGYGSGIHTSISTSWSRSTDRGINSTVDGNPLKCSADIVVGYPTRSIGNELNSVGNRFTLMLHADAAAQTGMQVDRLRP